MTWAGLAADCATTTSLFCVAGSITVTMTALTGGCGVESVTCVVVMVAEVAAAARFLRLIEHQIQAPTAQGTSVQKSAHTLATMGPIRK